VTGFRDGLLIFEWLTARGECPVEEACARFGLDRETFGNLIDTLAQVGFEPGSPDQLLNAFIDEEGDTVTVLPFGGLDRGVSIELETALRLDTVASALAELMEGTEVTRRASEKLRAALRASGVDPSIVAADLALPGSEHIAALGRAIAAGEQVRIGYRAASMEVTERTVDPVGIFLDGAWYLDAYDHLRGARRNFKLERIIDIEPTGERVTDAREPVAALHLDAGEVEIVLDLDPSAAWLIEHLEGANVEKAAKGRRRVRVNGGGVRWILPMLLAAGAHASVVGPEELRDALRAELDAMLAAYGT
jgi:predicted DNA-binding transcriptional regulator YafY